MSMVDAVVEDVVEYQVQWKTNNRTRTWVMSFGEDDLVVAELFYNEKVKDSNVHQVELLKTRIIKSKIRVNK